MSTPIDFQEKQFKRLLEQSDQVIRNNSGAVIQNLANEIQRLSLCLDSIEAIASSEIEVDLGDQAEGWEREAIRLIRDILQEARETKDR